MYAKGFCMCLLLILFLSLVPAYGNSNVLINPGFEDGTTAWGGRGCSIDVVSDPVYSGSYSGVAYDRGDTWQGIKQSMLERMIPGQTYKISGQVRLQPGAGPNSIGISVEQSDANGTRYIGVNWSTADGNDWTSLSGYFTLDVNGVLTTLDVYFEGPAPGVAFFVDDANVFGPEPIPPPPPDPNATGQIDINIRHQNIEGFGASVSWYEDWLVGHPLKDELYDILFGELGLDIYRIRNIYDQPGDIEYMSNTAEIITEGESSLDRPIKIMISSWSPPDYLKSNDNTREGTLKKDPNTGQFMYNRFAKWWADSLEEWSDEYGIDVEYVNIQNEPDYTTSYWDTCMFLPTETNDWAGYDIAFEAVWQELDFRLGSDIPKMLVADAAGLISSTYYLNALLDNPNVYGYAHHLYNIGSGDNPDAYIPAMENFASLYGNKPLMQTEYSQNIGTLADAVDLAVLMHNSLAVEGVSAYLYWELFWPYYSGLVSLEYTLMDPNDPNAPSVPIPGYTINPVYYAFKHYSAFVHSGWQRVEALCDNPYLRMSAYISPDNKKLSIVLINTTTDTDIELDLSLGDCLVLDGDVYRTSQTENCALIGVSFPCGLKANPKEKSISLKGFNPADLMILPPMTITTLALSTAGTPPVAVAGPNQVVYADVNGVAEVTLDGSGSYDDDGDSLGYYWSWIIGGNVYEANSVSPVVQLPVGEHQIELIVDDGINKSAPAYCTVNVLESEPLQLNVSFIPAVLNAWNRCGYIMAMIKMPEGITPSDINDNEPLLFNPGGIESETQRVFYWRGWCRSHTYVWAVFDKSDCVENLSPGLNEVSVVGKLTSGQYYEAEGCLRLVPMRWWWPWRQPFFHGGCNRGGHKYSCWGKH